MTPMEVVSSNGVVPQSQMSPQLSGRKKSIVPAAVPLTSFKPAADEPGPAVRTEGCSRSPLSIDR